MSNSKMLARHFQYEIRTGSGPGGWTPIRGLTNVSPSPTKNDADTTDYESDGWVGHIVASRGLSLSLSGQRVEDPTSGDRDAGQEAVETAAYATGYDSHVQLRVRTRSDDPVTVLQGRVSFEATSFGGGNDDPHSWEATATFDGRPEPYPDGNGNGGGDNGDGGEG